MVLLVDGGPVFGIVVEVQLSPDERKRFVWPCYVTNLRARLELPVCLFVVTVDKVTARWPSRSIDIGGSNRFRALVLEPSSVPEVTEARRAEADPELAVLSAMAHGRDADVRKAARIAAIAGEASLGLDEDRSRLYVDLVLASLGEAAKRELQAMDPAKYEYQSEFARRFLAQGRLEGKAEGKAEGMAEGRLEGRADLLTRMLTLRFGALSDDVAARISAAPIEELDAIGERLLTAQSLQEALGEG